MQRLQELLPTTSSLWRITAQMIDRRSLPYWKNARSTPCLSKHCQCTKDTSRTIEDPRTQLTSHFTLEEYLHSDTAEAEGIDNTPDFEIVSRLTTLALVMEKVRALFGGLPIYISSGYRCPELNEAVGGAAESAHKYGCANDFTIPDFGTVD